MKRLIPPRNACPVCGCRQHSAEKFPEYVVCDDCQEVLAPNELVRVKTEGTKRRYFELNPQ